MVQNTTSSRRRSPYGHAAVTRPRNTTTKPPLPADTVSRRTSVSTVKTKQSKQSKLTKKSTEKRDPPEAITNNKCGGRKKALGKSVTIKAPKTPARGKNYKGSDSKASGSTITTREDNSNTAFDEFSNTYDPFDPQQHHQYHQETHSGVGSRRTRVRPEVKGVKILSDDPTAIEMVEECINDIDFPGIQAFVAKGAGAMLACFANDVKAISGKTITAGGDCVANAPPLPNGGNCTTTKEILVLPVAECGAPAVDPKQEPYQKLVGKDLWSFYRAVCGSMTVKWKYDDAFRKLKDDPLYPYLNSCSGVNDISGEGQKRLVQVCTPGAVYSSLANKAKDSQPQLVEICKTLAKKLKLTKIGVGPIKEEAAAKAKAERKYGCNLCNITDYCRAFVVVEDIATLLALLEYVCENLGSSICRIKLSSLKDSPLPGGYRDCKINLMVRGHICEIQVHLFYLYSVCDVDGYQHYQECLQNDINAFNNDPFNVLNGYDQKTLGEIAQIAEKTIRVTSVDNISWENEEKIVDYFAIAGLLLHHEESFKAEVILRKLINLRTAKDQTPRMESNHPEVNHLKKALEKTLRQQNLVEEADLIADHRVEGEGQENATDAGSVSSASFFGSIAFDHNHKKRTDDEKKQKEKEAKLSRKQWTKIRQQRFSIISSYSVAQIALADINEQLNSFSGGGPPKTGSGTRRTRASPNPPVMRSSKGLKGSLSSLYECDENEIRPSFYLESLVILPSGCSVSDIEFYGDDGSSSLNAGVAESVVEGRQGMGLLVERENPPPSAAAGGINMGGGQVAEELMLFSYDHLPYKYVSVAPGEEKIVIRESSAVNDGSASCCMSLDDEREEVRGWSMKRRVIRVYPNLWTDTRASSRYQASCFALSGSRGVGGVFSEAACSMDLFDLEEDKEEEEDEEGGESFEM